MIGLIEKALLNQLEDGEAFGSMSISGRSLTLLSRKELIEERSFWQQELARYHSANSTSGIKQIRLNVRKL
jgi:hypothetical protein